jgi:hypothetical protein
MEASMSHEALVQVIERASREPAFRAQLQRDADCALAGYDLTAEERAQVLARETDAGHAHAVDVRVSKLADNPTIPGSAEANTP